MSMEERISLLIATATQFVLFLNENFHFDATISERKRIDAMATSTAPIGGSGTRARPTNSGSGTVAPLNTPTRRFYGSQDHLSIQEAGVSNPNVYVVQPFKQASVPKDMIYAKKVRSSLFIECILSLFLSISISESSESRRGIVKFNH